MSLGDLFKKIFQPRWPPLDDEPLRMRVATARAELLAPLLGGQVGREGETVVVLGTHRGRPAQFRIHLHFGTTEIQLGASRQLQPSVLLRQDPEIDQYRGGPPPIVTDPNKDRWLYLSPHAGLNGRAEVVAKKKALLDALPPPLLASLLATIEEWPATLFRVDTNQVVLDLDTPLLLSKDAPRIFGEKLELLQALTTAIEATWP